MNIDSITYNDVTNGIDIGAVIWVCGCSLNCPYCQNPLQQNPDYGYPITAAQKQELLDYVQKPYCKRVTFSGGHPLEPYNIEEVEKLIEEIRTSAPNIQIWIYTGYILQDESFKYITEEESFFWSNVDIVVDGPFIQEQRDITLPFRGSSNQRIIDVRESLKQKKIIDISNKF